ncbi:isocitrate lyase/phosphoenolpyruvate mutase family protein [Nonomuraea jabiensis]|uniref:isocitrate lyase/phosphoenolpyruvate mutase family protein n=1 Tax=Nonomuraea jabiensis TaxID=882448 RepID=UPI00368D81A8
MLGVAGQRLSRGEMVRAARRIVDSVDVPVTVDVEGGYGPGPADVAATVRAVVEAGAVGVNLEDSTAVGGPLFDVAGQSARLRAAREAAAAAGLPELFVNARTDVFLFGIGASDGRLGEVLERAEAYAEAGADGIFVARAGRGTQGQPGRRVGPGRLRRDPESRRGAARHGRFHSAGRLAGLQRTRRPVPPLIEATGRLVRASRRQDRRESYATECCCPDMKDRNCLTKALRE